MVVPSREYHEEPEVVVEVAWTDNYAEAFPEWTDISDRVQGFNSRLGRSTELGSIEAGIVNLVLDNSDGAFTAGNTISPFYPNVKPRRQVRVRIDDGSPLPDNSPILVNEVLNPNFDGDGSGCGFAIDPYKPTSFFGFGEIRKNGVYPDYGISTGSITAHAGRGSEIEPFPCSPGDFVSAAGTMLEVSPTLFVDGGYPFDGSLRIVWKDSDGDDISTSSHDMVLELYEVGIFHIENAQAPAGAAGFVLELAGEDMPNGAEESYLFVQSMAAYNHGSTEYDWPTTAQFYFGDTRDTDELRFAWEGVDNNSRSLVFTPPDRGNILGRGYVQNWPATFDGLTSDVTVPITDWQTFFSDADLPAPLDYEYRRRSPADLFLFADGEGATQFASEIHPSTFARPKLAYPVDSAIYGIAGTEAPSMASGDTLAPKGLPNVPSIRPQGQSRYTDTGSGIYFDLGVCIDVPVDVIKPVRDSFSLAFVWQLFDKTLFPGDNPVGLALYDSKGGDKQHGHKLLIYAETGTDNTIRLAVRKPDGSLYRRSLGTMPPNTDGKLYGFSWDHDLEVFRYITDLFDLNTAFIDEGDAFQLAGGDGSTFLVSDLIADARYDRLQLLGYVDPKIVGGFFQSAGFADQGAQFLARWDRALTSSELRSMLRAFDGMEGQTIDERLNYLLDVIEWPRPMRRIATSESVVPYTNYEPGSPALEEIQRTSNSAAGSFYVDRDGVTTFVDRHARIGAPIAYTFDHAEGTGLESGLTFNVSEDDLINSATINNDGGVTITIEDAASVQEFGRKSQSFDIRLSSDEEAIQFGYHVVSRNGEPKVRVESVSFNPSAHAFGDLWEVTKGITLGQRVACAGLPDTAPAESMTFFVESVSHDVVRDGERLKWTVTLELSPGDDVQGWILDDPVLSILDSTTIAVF